MFGLDDEWMVGFSLVRFGRHKNAGVTFNDLLFYTLLSLNYFNDWTVIGVFFHIALYLRMEVI